MELKHNNEPQPIETTSAAIAANPLLAEATFKPMLFSTPMVQAILNGTKSQTRRVVKMPPRTFDHHLISNKFYGESGREYLCPYGKIGSIIWVRETWQHTENFGIHISDENSGYIYKASENGKDWQENTEGWKWKPSLFMKKNACRLFLEITDTKVQRLQDIKEDDAIAEGIERENVLPFVVRWKSYVGGEPFADARNSFHSLWQKINGSWNDNPFVWVVTFKVVECPQGFC